MPRRRRWGTPWPESALPEGAAPGDSRRVGGRYVRNTAGRAPEWPDSPYFRSRYERNLARILTWMGVRWAYEPRRFYFRRARGTRNSSFLPDFYLPDEDVYYECKGWLDHDSQVRLKHMAREYPAVKVLLIDGKFFRAFEAQRLCRVVPGFECR